MTREEIKILEMFLHKQCDLERTKFAYSQEEIWNAVKMATEALEKQEDSKWIPCSEPPKTNGAYQITRKIQVGDFVHYIVTCAYFDGHNQWHNDNGVNSARKYLKDVIAWCPLLEPYKEGET